MIDRIGNILTGAQSAVVQSIKNAQGLLDKVQAKLASGKDVNSAIDNPQNFFLSLSLSEKASDFRRLLDGITQNIEAIKATNSGAEAILKLIDTVEALMTNARAELYPNGTTSLISELSDEDIAAILAVNPGLQYFPGNRSFYMLSAVPATWAVASATADAATINEPQGVTGVQGVTGHLSNITSQAENDFVHAMAPVNAWLGGGDGAVEGEWRWLVGPEAGQQFWQGGVGGSTVGGSYANWGGGEPNNSGNEDTVHMRPDGLWNDLPGGALYDYVIEWDTQLFLPPVDPALVELAKVYTEQYELLLNQIDELAKDTQYRGLHLLKNETMRTDFNPDRTSFLITEGIDATSRGLGLVGHDFMRLRYLTASQEAIRDAKKEVRDYNGRLAGDLNIITVRLEFTRNTIDIHKNGSEELVMADQNESAAELLALQVRQRLQMEALSLSMQSGANINRILS